MNVGFTGTRKGMLSPQKESFVRLLVFLAPGMESFHHGDCVGADAEAHWMVKQLVIDPKPKIVIHPPENDTNRAFCNSARLDEKVETREAKDYLVRNEDIIDETEVLIATPKGMGEEFRGSGTWHAVRYARKLGRVIWIVWPSGGTTVEIGERRVNIGRRLQIPLQYSSSLAGSSDVSKG